MIHRPAVEFVVEAHAEQAANLWVQRDFAIGASDFTLRDLEVLEDRLAAAIDGLRIAGDAGMKVCLDQVEDSARKGEVFVAGLLALLRGDHGAFRSLAESVGEELALGSALAGALTWAGQEIGAPWIEHLARAEAPQKRIALAAAASLRLPPFDLLLVDGLKSDWPPLRTEALRTVGLGRRGDLWHLVLPALRHPDGDCRFWAAWTGIAVGQALGLATMQELAVSEAANAERAAEIVCRLMPPAASLYWHRSLVAKGRRPRAALAAARGLGLADLAPWLLEQMRAPATARIAAEAFVAMTSLDLEAEDLTADRPEGFVSGPNDDPEDENVDADPDEGLPWPRQDGVERWWSQNRGRFPLSKRLCLGEPSAPASMREALAIAPQRLRAGIADELFLTRADAALFDVTAPARWQRQT